MSQVPDLAAIREATAALVGGTVQASMSPESLLAVLSLVDGLRAENERLRAENATLASSRDLMTQLARNSQDRVFDLQAENDRLRLALAGSPARKETQNDATNL